MDFRLLGAVEAWSMQQKVDLGPPKQRFLLAVLALQINQLVSVERLVDLTWPHSPPPTAHHAIHVRISQLRATLAARRNDGPVIQILTHGSSYVLRADPMCVDTHRFRALVTEARAQPDDGGKVVLYRRALGLWKGPPLADVAAPEIVDRLCAGLEEARLVALEECLDAQLRLGHHRMVVDELAELVAQHPYRQHLLAQLMLALYRAGRAPEALRAFKIARIRLIDELALEPELPLRQLERAILRADPALDLAEPERAVPVQWVPDASSGLPAIETVELSRRFGARLAVNEVSFAVQPAEIIGVLGAAGAGKTTMIRLLSTVLEPSAGVFSIVGTPSSQPVEIRRMVGVVPARAGQPRHLTGREYLTYHARLFGADRRDAPRQADRLLAEVGLDELACAKIATYGRDSCRRLELARALVNNPSVVMLDEPSDGLDPLGRRRILDLVRDIAGERGVTVLLATHDLAEVQRICGSVLVLDNGAAIASGRLGEVSGEVVVSNGTRVPR